MPPGRHLSLRCGRRRGFSGTPRRTSSTSCRTCRFSMCLCRSWGTRWWKSCRRSPLQVIEQCLSSLKTEFHSVLRFVVRRRRNSWWKCPRSCPSLLCSSRLPSRSSTFQFQVVEVVVDGEVFKVFPQDRIQQHGLWSRTLTFQFLEAACMFSLVVQAHPQFRVMSVEKVFSTLFPESKKKCEVRRESEPEGARQVELMDSGGLCGSAGQGRVLRVQPCLVEAGLGPGAPVLLLVHRRPRRRPLLFARVAAPLGVYPEGTVISSRPGTWSWPCDSFCTWDRLGTSSWSCGPCERWRVSLCPLPVPSL